MSEKQFLGKKVLIVPFPALGDLTIYIRLARNFADEGAVVTIRNDLLSSAKDIFPWLTIEKECSRNLTGISGDSYDLIIAHYRSFYDSNLHNHKNVAFVSAKPISGEPPFHNKSVFLDGIEYRKASRAFCLNNKSGMSMVQWVDDYCRTVFNMTPNKIRSEVQAVERAVNRILIFPLSPHAKKNYWLGGFKRIASRLRRKGWDVEFVCSPKEVAALEGRLNGYKILSFDTIGDLLKYISESVFVISNDSGGGHLASLCGLKTYTITRRDSCFAWRPGFTSGGSVITPVARFKFAGFYIWRPFVPYWRIVDDIGVYRG